MPRGSTTWVPPNTEPNNLDAIQMLNGRSKWQDSLSLLLHIGELQHRFSGVADLLSAMTASMDISASLWSSSFTNGLTVAREIQAKFPIALMQGARSSESAFFCGIEA
ncbi:hypothetical protein V6N12_055924 [Hibiscus sabdariffa]|uniref:Uncharacterized protein n=1 Tax=Hibiscus sabdariffa TaxID=183260 RepID=A0ABR2CR12_9ROSI